jgi:hypothetical protein
MVGLLQSMRLILKHTEFSAREVAFEISFATVILFTALALANSEAQAAPVAIKPHSRIAITQSKLKAKTPAAVKQPATKPDVLFEGYSKILLGDKHIGYTIQRFEFDSKKREYTTTYYLKTQPPANEVIESLKAKSTFELKPISSQYTELVGSQPHLVDATFANGIMTVSELVNGKRKPSTQKKVPPGTFLASFLYYVMLQQKDGVKVGNKYNYQAIAEEDGNIYSGESFVKSQETTKGLPSFKMLNTYKGVQYVSYSTPKGEVLTTESAAQGISTELVANIQEATKGMSVNSNQLAQLFGSVPKGQDNAVSRHTTGEPLGASAAGGATMTTTTPITPTAPTAPTAASDTAPKTKQDMLRGNPPMGRTKSEGVPQGQGIEVKGTQKFTEPDREGQ